jgi:hypothetical protein
MTRPTASADAPTVRQPDVRRLVYVRSTDLDRWQCRPLGSIEVLGLDDRCVGHLDGMLIDRRDNRPIHLVIAALRGAEPQTWFLVPIGDVWFDETERAIRIDSPREEIPFDPRAFERMSPAQADEFERHVLATCCQEVGFHHDGTPDY